MATSQWLFPLEALDATPSEFSLQSELYDRARSVEFLFRLGASLALPTSAMCTAATWFHRFYMRNSMQDFHRLYVAATCIFLATKTEECGRKLRDVARVSYSKVQNIDINLIPADSWDVEDWQLGILVIEEALLESICFDFVVDSPHAELLDMFEALDPAMEVQEYAWSLAHDSYRTPLCVLYAPRVTAVACYVLAQRIFDGPNSPSLDARISASSPSKSLPTPPSHKPTSPDASRAAVDHYNLQEPELDQVAEALSILLEFFRGQQQVYGDQITSIVAVPPPACRNQRKTFYVNELETISARSAPSSSQELPGRTPSSPHGDHKHRKKT